MANERRRSTRQPCVKGPPSPSFDLNDAKQIRAWLRSVEVRTREGADASLAPDEFLAAVTGRPLRLRGSERDAWNKAIRLVERRYCNGVEYKAPEVKASDYRKLLQSIATLRDALTPFGDGPECRLPVHPFGLLFQLEGVAAWAKGRLVEVHSGGRPQNRLFDAATRDLLRLYWHGFGLKPSPSPAGRAVRFLAAFFERLRGETLDDYDMQDDCDKDPASAMDGPEGAKAVVVRSRQVPVPWPSALPDLISKNLPTIERTPPGSWWGKLGLSRPAFSD